MTTRETNASAHLIVHHHPVNNNVFVLFQQQPANAQAPALKMFLDGIEHSNQEIVEGIKESNQQILKDVKQSNQEIIEGIKQSNQQILKDITQSNQLIVQAIQDLTKAVQQMAARNVSD
jgi:cell division septum initiation protein DivIVA